MTTTRRELAPRYDAAAVEPAIYERWLAADAFRPADEPPPGAERVRHHPAAAERDRRAPHRPRADRTVEDTLVRYHRMRGDDTLWLPGRRPRQHRRPVRPRPDHRRGGGDRARRSAASATSSGCGGSWTRRATSSASSIAASARALDWSRAALHDGRGQRARRAGRLQAAVGRRPRVPRRGARQLVPALPDHDQRPRERPSRRDGHAVDDPLPPRARRRHARIPTPGSASRPRGPRRCWATRPSPSTRTTIGTGTLVGREAILPFLGRRLPIVADEHVERDVRHRRGEDHAGPRPRRLRARPSATACRPSPSSTTRRA